MNSLRLFLTALISGAYAKTLKDFCQSGVKDITIGFESEKNLSFCKNGECLLSKQDIEDCPGVDFFAGYKLSQKDFPFIFDPKLIEHAKLVDVISGAKKTFLPTAPKAEKVAYKGLNIYFDFTDTSGARTLLSAFRDHSHLILTLDATNTWAKQIQDFNLKGLKRIVLKAKDANEFINAVEEVAVPNAPVYVIFTNGNQQEQIKLAREKTNWNLNHAITEAIRDNPSFADGFTICTEKQ
ncbi:hypothetical protein DSO57_1002482 [Entomophthora muscae]|uniref:Uncharacterized protein n=1 Tax=Entomophthora muscae TaxID=34485 RepID=A0ACC2TWK8_9FUNG|nr:hypothetical protein DSO57_1002482 [Entomophthora muscae]